MSRSKTYNPVKVNVAFAGILISGEADGAFLTIEENAPRTSTVVGAAGEHVRVVSADKSAKITLTLLQTSSANAALSALAALDRATGEGRGPFLATDLNGTSIHSASDAWVEEVPSVEYGKDLGERAWIVGTGDLDQFIGGNL